MLRRRNDEMRGERERVSGPRMRRVALFHVITCSAWRRRNNAQPSRPLDATALLESKAKVDALQAARSQYPLQLRRQRPDLFGS